MTTLFDSTHARAPSTTTTPTSTSVAEAMVSSYIGSGECATKDNSPATAGQPSFEWPQGITGGYDQHGHSSVYVTENGGNVVRKLSHNGIYIFLYFLFS